MIIPIGNRILVKVDEDNESIAKDGILVSTARKDKPLKGKIIATGNGTKYFNLVIGDYIMFSSYGYETIEDNGEEFALLTDNLILCKIN